ncbi:MAG TPA: nitroreductase family deazaflavin-dependent oxidoreductase [Anaerolineales bacterium]|jgi:deazaflavin-dependent oxidoreductase (nitroreductase family)|nr:nitroreductase family deazaflavin-dependent oxidoreductase [Anaerolineales bacterium]HQX15452.1 nitroreductase family deazaflavin-dependent oxidoreductase [Anaerolineales bacterium]
MTIQPNAFQKFIHRFLMLKPVSALLSKILFRADTLLLWATKGKLTVTRIVGLSVIQLTTRGAKTGKLRTMPLIGFPDGEKIALIASYFGGEHNPGWYYNLKANPECDVRINGETRKYLARESFDEEREKYFQMANSYYAGYEKYRERAAHRHIPVMVLERKDSLTTKDTKV